MDIIEGSRNGSKLVIFFKEGVLNVGFNRTAHIRHHCGKTAILSCHRCLINTGVEKMNNI